MNNSHSTNSQFLSWTEAALYLKDKGIIAYPTDTVWGLGCRADDPPLSLHCLGLKGGAREHIASIITVPEKIGSMVVLPDHWEELLPGPYTLVLPLKTHAFDHIASKDHFLGCRIPKHQMLLNMVGKCDFPIITTSLNHTGQPPIRSIQEAQALASDWRIGIIEEETRLSGPSTVLKWDGSNWTILRKGIGPLPSFLKQ